MSRRLLVIANETLDRDWLNAVPDGYSGHTAVFVVAPVLCRRRLDYWTGDDREARQEAAGRLATSVRRVRATGADVDGVIGDGDPLLAIEDALRTFPAGAIVLVTRPRERACRLERNLVERAAARFPIPLIHVAARRSNNPPVGSRTPKARLRRAFV